MKMLFEIDKFVKLTLIGLLMGSIAVEIVRYFHLQ
jgi:hypothetical protein